MKALIFGANGQDGFYLSEACKKRDIEVIGISQHGPWFHGNISNRKTVESLIREHLPNYIFHLAATSTTKNEAIFENHESIGTGTINILEAVKQWAPECKVFLAGSGLQFVNVGNPLSEESPFCHNSCYAATRNYSIYMARYFRTLGIKTYVGYLFHHESPLRKAHHVSQKIIQGVKDISLGGKVTLELGDISVVKEWTYAADIVEGILTLIEQEKVFEATIGSGRGYSIKEWIIECFNLIGKEWRDYIKEKDNFKPEYTTLISNPQTINSLGWKATTPISELAKIMLNH